MTNYYQTRQKVMIRLKDWIVTKLDGNNKESYQELVREISLSFGTPKSLLDKMMKENWGLTINEEDEIVKA